MIGCGVIVLVAVVLTVIRPKLAWREEAAAGDSVAENHGLEGAKVDGVRGNIPVAYDLLVGQQFVRRIRLQQSIDAQSSSADGSVAVEMASPGQMEVSLEGLVRISVLEQNEQGVWISAEFLGTPSVVGLGFEKVAGAFSRSIPLRISRTGEILEKRISPKVPPVIAGFWDSVLDCLVVELPGKEAGEGLAEWRGSYADSFAVYEMDFRVFPERILERQKRRVVRLISQGGGNSLAGLEPMAKGVSGLDRIQFSKGNGLLREGEFNAELHLAVGEAMELFATRKCQVEFHSDIFGRGEDVLSEFLGEHRLSSLAEMRERFLLWERALEQATALAAPQLNSEQAVVAEGSAVSLDAALERLAALDAADTKQRLEGFRALTAALAAPGVDMERYMETVLESVEDSHRARLLLDALAATSGSAAQDALADLILDGGPDLRKMALYSSAHSSTPSRRLVDAVASVLDAPLLENSKDSLYEQCLALGITGAFAAQSEPELQAELYARLVRFEEHLVGDARDQAYLAGLSNTQRPEAAERIMEFAQNTEDAPTLEAAIDFVGAVAQPIARELLLEYLESEAGQANRGAVMATLATQRLPHDIRIDEVLSGALFDYAEGSSWEARVEAARYFSADVEEADIPALQKLLNEMASLDPDKRVRNFVTHTLKKLDQREE